MSRITRWFTQKIVTLSIVFLNILGIMVLMLEIFEDALPDLWLDEAAQIGLIVVTFYVTQAMRHRFANTFTDHVLQWAVMLTFIGTFVADFFAASGSSLDEWVLAIAVLVLLPGLALRERLAKRVSSAIRAQRA
jgi:hypothetical protein